MTRTLATALLLAAATPALAQPSSPWNGWAQCQVDTTGPGYADTQTHTWVLTGAPPTMQGVFAIHPGTWSAVGSGSAQRTSGSQPLQARWTTNVTNVSAPLSISVRTDKRIVIRTWHDRLGVSAGITGTEQATTAATRPSVPTPLAFQAWESTFPMVEGSEGGVISGSSTMPTNATTSPMQAAGATRATSCAWQFGQGGVALSPPPPPPAVSTAAPSAISTTRPASTAQPTATIARPLHRQEE